MRVQGFAGGRTLVSRTLQILLLTAFLSGTVWVPAEAQILNRLRKRAEEALGETAVIQKLLEEPPGITTSIHDAHTEIPFLDGHAPTGSADLGALPRDSRNAFFAPPGLYEMEALSYCIHAGTYGPSGGDGYALAPLKGELAPILETVVRRSMDHPEVGQAEIQSLIWALQARIPVNEMSRELQMVAEILLDPDQLASLSEGFVDLAKEELLVQARERMPEAIRRVAEVEARLRSLLREGATFSELEEAAVLVGAPPPSELVREVPLMRWNYHPDGYFIRLAPEHYALTYVQTYIPEEYRLRRDGEGRVQEILGPRGVRLVLEYAKTPEGARGKMGLLTGVLLQQDEEVLGEWDTSGWTLTGNDLPRSLPGSLVSPEGVEARAEAARTVRRQAREVIASALGSDPGRPGRNLADLSGLRMALSDEGVSEEVLQHLANAWQFELCLEAGGCASPALAWRDLPQEWGRKGGSPGVPRAYQPIPGLTRTPFRRAGGTTVDPGGNVAAPGSTGSQRLLQSGRSPVEKANAAMKVMGFFLALADVIGSAGSLGSMAYNALGMAGLPVGHLGLPTMMAGAMISQVVDAWSSATDALAGDTGSGAGGDSEGGEGGSEGGGDAGGSDPGGGWDPGGADADPFPEGLPGGGADPSQERFDGSDYQDTPSPTPPPNPSPPPPGGGGGGGPSQERSRALEAFGESLITTLHHTQSFVDSDERHQAACQAGDTEWAVRQAELAGRHRTEAAQGMLKAAEKLDALLAVARAEGVLEAGFAYPEELEGVQSRLAGEGWSLEELEVSRRLGITGREMETLRQRLLGRGPEDLSGQMEEAVQLWAKELRTAGYLWLALPQPQGTCPQGL